MSVLESGGQAVCPADIDLDWDVEPRRGWMTKVRLKMAAGKEKTVELVQRNPYTTIAIAAGIGFVAGLILKRR